MTRYATMQERLLANSTPMPCGYGSDCWVWVAQCSRHGYPRLNVRRDGRLVKLYAHRLALEVFSGRKLRKGDTVDHLCRNTYCIAPLHLQVCTRATNNRRKRAAYRDGLVYADAHRGAVAARKAAEASGRAAVECEEVEA